MSNRSNENQKLYFWYFPSSNINATNELTIWLNGGPGCSSLLGLLAENGPFTWHSGTYQPLKNPYSWTNLTNVLYVDQPVGTGFSQGSPSAKNESDVANQFLGFLRNFMDTFDLQGRKIFLAGESYAGAYIPYITDAMLRQNDTKYSNVQGILLYDPVISIDAVQMQMPALGYYEANSNLFPLNSSFVAQMRNLSTTCGYTDFMRKYLVWPPLSGPMPVPPRANSAYDRCDVWGNINRAMLLVNPCFDVYHVTATCPLPWDVLAVSGSRFYASPGSTVYFDRSDVQKAINAPQKSWSVCTPDSAPVFVNGADASPPSGLSVLPRVIERLNRTIIAHGSLDYVLIANGTLLAIQNMTWNGAQGFQRRPTEDFYVPYHTLSDTATLSGAGILGVSHTERGLTYVETSLTGHQGPEHNPSAAYRQLEFLLGRVKNLSEPGSFTTDYNLVNLG